MPSPFVNKHNIIYFLQPNTITIFNTIPIWGYMTLLSMHVHRSFWRISKSYTENEQKKINENIRFFSFFACFFAWRFEKWAKRSDKFYLCRLNVGYYLMRNYVCLDVFVQGTSVCYCIVRRLPASRSLFICIFFFFSFYFNTFRSSVHSTIRSLAVKLLVVRHSELPSFCWRFNFTSTYSLIAQVDRIHQEIYLRRSV